MFCLCRTSASHVAFERTQQLWVLQGTVYVKIKSQLIGICRAKRMCMRCFFYCEKTGEALNPITTARWIKNIRWWIRAFGGVAIVEGLYVILKPLAIGFRTQSLANRQDFFVIMCIFVCLLILSKKLDILTKDLMICLCTKFKIM